jgi:hypothetical protein
VKPAPVSAAALIVTAAVPTDVRLNVFVADVLTAILPKLRLVELTLSVGVAAFNQIVKLLDTPAAVAVSVETCDALIDEMVAENATLEALAGIVTVMGTVTTATLLERLMFNPPAGAGAVSAIVQASVPFPVIEVLVHKRELNAGGTCPLPLKLTVVLAALEELLLILR